jgi:uridine kinase
LGDIVEAGRIGFTCGGFTPNNTAKKEGCLPIPEARSLERGSEKDGWREALINKYGITAEWLKPAEAMEWLGARIRECEDEKRFENLDEGVGIAVGGPSGGGKTKNSEDLIAMLATGSGPRALLLSEDWYYRDMAEVAASGHNFDEPAALRLHEKDDDFRQLVSGNSIERECYDKITGRVSKEKTRIDPKDVVITEGLFALLDGFCDNYDIKVYVHAPFHAWFIRRLMRDVKEGKTAWSLLESARYIVNVVKPMYDRYIEPTMKNADIIIENDYDPFKEAGRCGMLESQRKYRADVDVARLESLRSVRRLMRARQVDHYYTDGSFRKTGEIVRIREESDSATIFTYKGPKTSPGALERQKLEFEIDAETGKGLLAAYTKTGVIRKDRAMYSYKGVLFYVDTDVTKVAGGEGVLLGNFVEIQVPEREDKELVGELLGALGIDSACIPEAYSEM